MLDHYTEHKSANELAKGAQNKKQREDYQAHHTFFFFFQNIVIALWITHLISKVFKKERDIYYEH